SGQIRTSMRRLAFFVLGLLRNASVIFDCTCPAYQPNCDPAFPPPPPIVPPPSPGPDPRPERPAPSPLRPVPNGAGSAGALTGAGLTTGLSSAATSFSIFSSGGFCCGGGGGGGGRCGKGAIMTTCSCF